MRAGARRAGAACSALSLAAAVMCLPLQVCAAAGDAASASANAHALTPLGMFMAADPVVKAIIVGLMVASLATWTIWIAKTVELALAKRRLAAGLLTLRKYTSLYEVRAAHASAGTLVARMVREASAELELSSGIEDISGLRERIASRLGDVEQEASRSARTGTGILATIGSTAPFVGLLGTVWGIMNSFIGIAASHTTNLAVVAPGIAEALLATAVGLVAAIPAVVIYNRFSRAIGSYRALLRQCVGEVTRMASRDMDRAPVLTARLSRAAE